MSLFLSWVDSSGLNPLPLEPFCFSQASEPLWEARMELNGPTRMFLHQAGSESLGAGSDLAGGHSW